MKKTLLILLSLVFSFNVYLSSQSVVYVASGGTGDGSAWTSALGDIQAGISVANTLDPKGEVWIKAGTYTVTAPVNMNQGVNLYGGFAGTETAKDGRQKKADGNPWDFTNETIIDGGGTNRVVESRGTFTTETILDGVTLTNGNGVSTSTSGTGGGIIIRPGFKVQNCIIRNNTTSTGGGGGVSMTGGALINSYIYKNTQTLNGNGGGGVHVNTLVDFESIIENCTFESNSSTIRGGGLNVQGAGFTKMIGIRVFNNNAEGKQGGAIYQNSVNNSMVNSLVYNNTGSNAIQLRGSIFNSTIVNNVGGVYFGEKTAEVEFSNNIIWGCITETGGTTATSLTGTDNPKFTAHNNATYNPIANTTWVIANNIQFSSNNSNGDVENPAAGTVGSGPKFTKVSTFKGIASADEEILILDSVNWSLQLGSPCIDAGKTLAAVTTDILGLTRPQGTAYEIGAYEKDPATGLSNNEFIYSVYSRDKQIVISGFEHPVKVAVYSVSGQTIYTKTISGSSIEIPVQKGIYIVRVDNSAQKVLVK